MDVVAVLTDSKDPTIYWCKLKQRMREESNETETNCHGLKITAVDDKKHLTDVADTEQLLRIIQFILSPEVEPFKMWLAQIGRERIKETIDISRLRDIITQVTVQDRTIRSAFISVSKVFGTANPVSSEPFSDRRRVRMIGFLREI